VAIAGAVLGGGGFSLVYPSLGVALMHRCPPASRGMVIGGFSAFFDLAIGLAGPLGGAVAALAGYRALFGVAAAGQVLALVLLARAEAHAHD